MIRLEVIDNDEQNFILFADEPMRVEVSVSKSGEVLADVYQGVDVDMEQEPLGCYDGNINGDEHGGNGSWDVDESHRQCPRCMERFEPDDFEDHVLGYWNTVEKIARGAVEKYPTEIAERGGYIDESVVDSAVLSSTKVPIKESPFYQILRLDVVERIDQIEQGQI